MYVLEFWWNVLKCITKYDEHIYLVAALFFAVFPFVAFLYTFNEWYFTLYFIAIPTVDLFWKKRNHAFIRRQFIEFAKMNDFYNDRQLRYQFRQHMRYQLDTFIPDKHPALSPLPQEKLYDSTIATK